MDQHFFLSGILPPEVASGEPGETQVCRGGSGKLMVVVVRNVVAMIELL